MLRHPVLVHTEQWCPQPTVAKRKGHKTLLYLTWTVEQCRATAEPGKGHVVSGKRAVWPRDVVLAERWDASAEDHIQESTTDKWIRCEFTLATSSWDRVFYVGFPDLNIVIWHHYGTIQCVFSFCFVLSMVILKSVFSGLNRFNFKYLRYSGCL